MRPSRREFVKWVTASGIALSLSRLASAEEPTFAARETLPGRQTLESGRHRRRPHRRRRQGHRRQALRLRFSRRRYSRLAGEDRARHPRPCARRHARLYRHRPRAPDRRVKANGGRHRRRTRAAGTRVPEFYAGDLFCPVGRTPLYLGQPVALLIFETFDAFDQARLEMRDGTLREVRRGDRRRRDA